MDDVLRDIQRALVERQQQGAMAREALYGGQGAYFDAFRRARSANQGHQMARIIVRSLRAGKEPADLRCHPTHLKMHGRDPAILAFWRSVAAAGKDGWR